MFGQLYISSGQSYPPKPAKLANDDAASKEAVTPEEAQRLYNRPKTNPPPKFDPKSKWPRIAGEFEEQNAILISVSELLPQHGGVLKRIAELTENHVPLVILFNDSKQVLEAVKVLRDSKQSLSHISFLHFKLDTVWLRDFGPVLAEKENGVMSIDFFYNGQRPTDDHFPRDWAKLTAAEHNSVPWTIQGGNLLCNGIGLALTTTRIFDDNKVIFKRRPGVNIEQEQQKFVLNEFKQYTNLKHIEVLLPLQNEKTKHVDMFATFVNSKEVLVAKVDPRLDPVNARILDYNAKKLQRIQIDGKPLTVHRIPIPVRRGTSWSPYTNVIVANRLIMMPVMQTDDRATMRDAIEVYRNTFPNHRIATVDITTMAKLQGALHCMSIHVPSYVPLPDDKLVSYQRAVDWAKKQEAKK
ncbi:agmatine deiminase family protein [Mariniblastus fucicola]|uniref:agmatine deiminase family protein n=1 Tax=Mariniblastus fucicola TaxID=980251 RepID=UPI0009466D1D|nr:agmatine deiminase family protein [Mariniblastus fucicola]